MTRPFRSVGGPVSDRGDRRRRGKLRTARALLLLAAVAACRREPSVPRAPLRPAVPEAWAKTLIDGERVARAGALVPGDAFFEWELPEGADGAPASVVVLAGEKRKRLADRRDAFGSAVRGSNRAGPTRAFLFGRAVAVYNEEVALRTRGRRPRLRLRLEPAAPLFVSDVRLILPGPAPDPVVLLLFDTTRHDAVGFGGCKDPSTPNLDAILRDAWKARRAYAAASWTIPSVASLLTGRVPAVNEDSSGSPLGIVPGVATAAEDFARAGWSTAAFMANPTLRAENGFAAGFSTFFVTPYDGASIVLPGRETLKHVPLWLAAHRGEPFFLLINLLDPHDPYQPDDRPRGKTPFDPGYVGPIVGDEVNRLQLHEMPTPPPPGVRHLEALYHDEVRLADAEFGRLWNDVPEGERARWTFVFTADHGEELHEHGGWKHGPALFDEVLRVPLAIRPGNGRTLPAASSDDLVSLLDLLPTLEGLAGLPRPQRPLDGVSLLDPSAGKRASLPAVTMLTGGAPRAAVVRPAGKLVFFDRLGTRGIPDPVKDPPGYRLARLLPGILPALGSFDLARDPGETRLLPIDHATFGADWQAIERAMAHTRRGIELRAVGPGAGAGLDLTVEGFGAAASVEPFALEEDDRFSWKRSSSGRKLAAALDLSNDVDGFLFDDAAGEDDLRVTLRGGASCAQLVLAGVRPVPLSVGVPQPVPRAAIPEAVPVFAAPGGCAGVFLWKAPGSLSTRTPAEEDEAVKRLRALGYLH